MSIGEVLRRLSGDFPDVTISKIRFLEAEGLVEPERTGSGYRKFSAADLDRLRYILRAQRDHYLPLRVIREHLDALERGLEPPATAGSSARVPAQVAQGDADSAGPELRLSRAELIANSDLTDAQLAELEEFGLVRPRPGSGDYDGTALTVATIAAAMAGHGLGPRHLRTFKTAADRELGLIDQVVAPVARSRDEDAALRAEALRSELTGLATRLHAALLRAALQSPR
jgi:DNA-binding transcriptional MerR regulator